MLHLQKTVQAPHKDLKLRAVVRRQAEAGVHRVGGLT